MAAPRAIINSQAREFYLPAHEGLAALIPETRDVVIHGDNLMAFPHTTDVTRLARNFGFIVPAPIINQYPWPVSPAPFQTQKTTAALLTMNARAYVLSEMGTGKTRAALFACDHMIQNNEIKRVLVAAPLSTLSQVWDREIFQYFNHLSVGVIYGTRERREEQLTKEHHFYVINHDGVGVVLNELMLMKFDVVIVDEIGCFRNARTDRWRNMFAIVKDAPYAWGMTGSPTPNTPVDAWGIAKMLTPSRATQYKKSFQRKTMTQITQFRWIAKPDANDHVYAMLQPAVRYKRDDCLELPDVSYVTTKIEQSKSLQKVYDQLFKKLKVGFKEGWVTAANEGVVFMKLMQIACGWVYTTEKGVVSLDNRKRVQEVVDLYDASAGKVIVFACFKHAAQELHKRMLKKKIDCVLVTGDTPKPVRDEIFGVFQTSPEKSMIVAHPQCMSHGLTLTAANTIIWFTPTTSLETYEQACARIQRPGQKRKSLIIHLTGSAIETKIYSRLRQKASVQGALLDMFDDN
ncbi:hypothetical protein LCGC14_1215900 [marine sediment metagenome]|uniref:Helicase ATP-binding domain-containing protein n=1 Tax=marine sediment metagenome TaxID=412755 RepID=A0A0F9M028_9ZZZZ